MFLFVDSIVSITGVNILKLVLNCCITGPKLLRASLIYTSAQQFRTNFEKFSPQLNKIFHTDVSRWSGDVTEREIVNWRRMRRTVLPSTVRSARRVTGTVTSTRTVLLTSIPRRNGIATGSKTRVYTYSVRLVYYGKLRWHKKYLRQFCILVKSIEGFEAQSRTDGELP